MLHDGSKRKKEKKFCFFWTITFVYHIERCCFRKRFSIFIACMHAIFVDWRGWFHVTMKQNNNENNASGQSGKKQRNLIIFFFLDFLSCVTKNNFAFYIHIENANEPKCEV